MDEDDDHNIDNKPVEPKINQLEVSSFRQSRSKRWQQRSQDKKRCNSSHEPVAEVLNVDKKSDKGQQPKKKWL